MYAPRNLLHSKLAESYIRDLARYPVLKEDELKRLMDRAHAGDRAAYNRVVHSNLRFVVEIASEYHSPDLSFDELVAEGNIGLMRAAERFNPDKGYKFTTYAVWWIRQAIRKAIHAHRHPVRLPTNRLEDLDRIRRSSSRFSQEEGRPISIEETASNLEMTPRRVQAALDTQKRAVSLDASLGEDGDRTYYEYFADTGALPDEEVIQQDLGERVREALLDLQPRDAEVISLTFGLDGDPLTLKQVGERMGLTRERVRQIRNRGLRQLRRRLSELNETFEDYEPGMEMMASAV